MIPQWAVQCPSPGPKVPPGLSYVKTDAGLMLCSDDQLGLADVLFLQNRPRARFRQICTIVRFTQVSQKNSLKTFPEQIPEQLG